MYHQWQNPTRNSKALFSNELRGSTAAALSATYYLVQYYDRYFLSWSHCESSMFKPKHKSIILSGPSCRCSCMLSLQQQHDRVEISVSVLTYKIQTVRRF